MFNYRFLLFQNALFQKPVYISHISIFKITLKACREDWCDWLRGEEVATTPLSHKQLYLENKCL